MTLSTMTFSIKTLSITIKICITTLSMITLDIMISSIIPSVVYAECHHVEGRYAECCGANHKVRFTQCVFAVGYQLPMAPCKMESMKANRLKTLFKNAIVKSPGVKLP